MANTSERRCVVPGCRNTRAAGKILHKFPNPRNDMSRYIAWIQAIGIDINSLDPHYVHKNRKVCHDHFETKFLTWSKRLSYGAVPTLLLPESRNASIPDSTNAPIPDSSTVTHDEPSFSPRNITPVPKSANTVGDDPWSSEYTVVQKIQSEDAENTFSWQKSNEAITIPEDDVEMEDIPNDMSMYVEDDDPTSLRHDHDTSSEDKSKPHAAFWCNMCNKPITGFRYTCVQCSDLDLCGACEADTQHSQHYVLRVPAFRLITEVQSVLATIRRNLMHKLDPINEPDQDCGDAVSVKSEVKSEVDTDDDAPKNQLDDDNDGSSTSSQALEYEYLEEESSTDSIEEIKTTQSLAEEPVVSAYELSSETNIMAESKTAIHTTGTPERDKKSPMSNIDKTNLVTNMKNYDTASAKNTKDTDQVLSVQKTIKVSRVKSDREIEQSQIKFGTIIKDARPQGGGKEKLARIVQVKGLRLPTIPGYQHIKPGSSVRLMRLPANIQQNAKQKAKNTKDAEQVLSMLKTTKLRRAKLNKEVEQSQIKFRTIIEDAQPQGGEKDKLAQIVQVKCLRVSTMPRIKPGPSVRLMRLPANIQLNAKQKDPQATSATHTTTTHEQNR